MPCLCWYCQAVREGARGNIKLTTGIPKRATLTKRFVIARSSGVAMSSMAVDYGSPFWLVDVDLMDDRRPDGGLYGAPFFNISPNGAQLEAVPPSLWPQFLSTVSSPVLLVSVCPGTFGVLAVSGGCKSMESMG